MLDTSVLITTLRSSSGAAAESVRLVLLRELTILMDFKLCCEFRDVAFRSEHLKASGKTRQQTSLLLDMLEALAEPVLVVDRHAPLSQDPGDDMVLEVAINGDADAIVTNKAKHFLSAAMRIHLPVLTPAELLNQFRIQRG